MAIIINDYEGNEHTVREGDVLELRGVTKGKRLKKPVRYQIRELSENYYCYVLRNAGEYFQIEGGKRTLDDWAWLGNIEDHPELEIVW